MKKIISMVLLVVLLCSTTVFADSVFKDVPADYWAYEQIQFFYNEGIVIGTSADTFSPDTFVTREQLAKMISVLYGRDNYTPTKQAFTDVTPDMWSYSYIDSVKEYLPGYAVFDGTSVFKPYNVATREDVAYALVKISGVYNEVLPDEAALEEFADGDTVTYNRKDFVSVAVKSGLMQGYDGYLRPKDGITRAEAVTLLYRTIQQPETEFVPETETVVPDAEEEVTIPEVITGEITYTVTEVNGFEAWGYIRLNYGNVAVVNNSEFTSGEGNYAMEITETEKITDSEIICIINIYLDGEIEAESINVKITDYNGENPQIISNDGKWNIKLKIEN